MLKHRKEILRKIQAYCFFIIMDRKAITVDQVKLSQIHYKHLNLIKYATNFIGKKMTVNLIKYVRL